MHAGARWLIVGVGTLAVSALLLRTVTAKADLTEVVHSESTEPNESVRVSALAGGDGGLRAD